MIGEMTANCTKNQMTAIFPDDGVVVTCRRVFLQNFNPLPILRKKNPSKKFIKITRKKLSEKFRQNYNP